MHPIIDIDDERTTGGWRLLARFALRNTNDDRRPAVRYDGDRVRIDAGWEFRHPQGAGGLNGQR